MKLIDKKKDVRFAIVSLGLLTYVVTIFLLSVNVQKLNTDLNNISTETKQIKASQQTFEINFAEELFNEHLALAEKTKIENELASLEAEYENLKQSDQNNTYIQIDEIYALTEDFQKKVTRNNTVKIDSANVEEKVNEWGTKLINKELDALKSDIQNSNTELDNKYKEYLASLPPPPPASGNGYSFINVTTEKGTRHGVYLVKLPLNSYRVKTVSAAGDNCKDNCPTKSLAQYIQENGAVAGMNGSYFCPPDYSSCGGKVNSFDYAFYDSNKGKWINKDARSWFDTGMIAFNGTSPKFYKKTSEYGGESITAAISNYPALLKNGDIAVDNGILTSYQKDVRGTRGAIGFGGENLYLALITNATVIDAAYAMKALGAQNALNLDGGGSSAMFANGGYVVGPGRSLPNAVVVVKN